MPGWTLRNPVPALVIGVVLAAGLTAAGTATGAGKAGPKPGAPAGGRIELYSVAQGGAVMTDRIEKTQDEWRKQLSAEEYRIAREKGTERAFTGKYWDNHEHGTYQCVCCGNDLFASETKFDSGTGWPSFYAPVDKRNVAMDDDRSLMMRRTEVLCSRCDAHLGHVFPDGPKPTGLRYCINSASLKFEKAEEK